MKQDFLTPSAQQHIEKLLESHPTGAVFRVAVDAGGCNGFQYLFKIESQAQDEDEILHQGGVAVAIDPVSKQFLVEAQIDYVEELIGSYFKVENPNTSTSCGCGNSFSI